MARLRRWVLWAAMLPIVFPWLVAKAVWVRRDSAMRRRRGDRPRLVYGPIPIELGVFADGGFAWSEGEEPTLFGGDRKGVASVGATARVNVLGFVVVAVNFVKPLERRQKGWIWQFSFTPGF